MITVTCFKDHKEVESKKFDNNRDAIDYGNNFVYETCKAIDKSKWCLESTQGFQDGVYYRMKIE